MTPLEVNLRLDRELSNPLSYFTFLSQQTRRALLFYFVLSWPSAPAPSTPIPPTPTHTHTFYSLHRIKPTRS
jgi:hypothetical protein